MTEARRHNMMIGHVAASKKKMQAIIAAKTPSEPAKRTAAEIITKLEDLDGFLRARRK